MRRTIGVVVVLCALAFAASGCGDGDSGNSRTVQGVQGVLDRLNDAGIECTGNVVKATDQEPADPIEMARCRSLEGRGNFIVSGYESAEVRQRSFRETVTALCLDTIYYVASGPVLVEAGQNEATYGTLSEIAKALGVDVAIASC